MAPQEEPAISHVESRRDHEAQRAEHVDHALGAELGTGIGTGQPVRARCTNVLDTQRRRPRR